jgi:hypothetical protein
MQMRTLLSTSLLASLLASASFAAEAGTITGTVKNADGMPFRAAFVRVQNTKTRMTMMVASDRQGRYFTDELVPGAYQVWATSVGYKSDPSRRVSVTVDEKGRRTVDFTMQTSAVQWSQLTKFQAGVLLPEAEGNAKHVLIQRCFNCHAFGKIGAIGRRDFDGWKDSIDVMRRMGVPALRPRSRTAWPNISRQRSGPTRRRRSRRPSCRNGTR